MLRPDAAFCAAFGPAVGRGVGGTVLRELDAVGGHGPLLRGARFYGDLHARDLLLVSSAAEIYMRSIDLGSGSSQMCRSKVDDVGPFSAAGL